MPVVSDYTALLNGWSWAGQSVLNHPLILTYSFETALPSYFTTGSARIDATFRAMDATYVAYAKSALAAWANASGLTFIEVPAGQGDLRFFHTDILGEGLLGRAGLPFGVDASPSAGDIEIAYPRSGWDPTPTLLHEIGHAIGLKHPHEDDPTLSPALDKNANTVMSYDDTTPDSSVLGPFDLQAVQALYGQNSADGAGLVSWSMNTTTWVLTQNGDATAGLITGVYGADSINGGDGADSILGGFGADTLSGDDGADSINGGQGSDLLAGGAGADTLVSYHGGDRLDGGDGDDRVTTSWVEGQAHIGGNTLIGGLGNDTLIATNGSESLDGGAGADQLSVWYTGSYTATGGAGADSLYGGQGADFLYGGEDNDQINGGAGTNFLRGELGDDIIWGGDGFDDAHGNQGNDSVSGGGYDDWVVGGQGNDALWGDAGLDIVLGNLGNDTCQGGDGVDVLRGGQGDDVVYGDAGDDYVSGDRGSDTLYGGAGADSFHSFAEAGVDRVMDFDRAQGDRVLLDPGTVYTVAQSGSNVVIDFGSGNQMVLVNLQLSTLGEGWILSSYDWR